MLTAAAYAGLNAQSLACEKPKDRAKRSHPPAANRVRSPRSRGRACKAGRCDDLEFATQRPRAAPDLSVVERHDRVAFADGPAELDPTIEPGAVEQRGIDRPCQQLLEVLAGKVQPSTAQYRLADLEALADEMIERHAERGEIAAMFSGRNLNLLAWKRRVAAGDRVEHFHFDERHLAHVGFWRVGADAIEIPIAFDPATGDQLGFVELLHRERRSFGDMNMEQAAGPAHHVSPGRSFAGGDQHCARVLIPPPAATAVGRSRARPPRSRRWSCVPSAAPRARAMAGRDAWWRGYPT